MTTDGYGSAWSAGLQRASDAELDAWLAFAMDACDTADAISLAAFRSELTVTRKADGSFVTQADQRIETFIRERIIGRYPSHGIVGEEYGTADVPGRCRWFVDPIDGTHNFMRGVPLFGTLLAVECDGELQAGVVSAPALGRRWWARRGAGAWVREPGSDEPRRVHVSEVDQVSDAQIVYRSILDMRASRVAAGFERLLDDVWRERGFGDFWGYMLVADGAAELMIERDLGAWDLAAPWIVVEEAGGRITDFDGRRTVFGTEGMASNGRLHGEFLGRLRD
jgi:histidinol-phosphatase